VTQTAYFGAAAIDYQLVEIDPSQISATGEVINGQGPDIIENGVDTGVPSYLATLPFSWAVPGGVRWGYFRIPEVCVNASLTAPASPLSTLFTFLVDPAGVERDYNFINYSAVTVPDNYILPTFTKVNYIPAGQFVPLWGTAFDALRVPSESDVGIVINNSGITPGIGDSIIVGDSPYAILGGTIALPNGDDIPTLSILNLNSLIWGTDQISGPWTITGTGTIDNLVVDTGSVATISLTVTNVPIYNTPAGVTLLRAPPIGTTFNFDGPVTYTATMQGSFTVVSVTDVASQLIIANVSLPGHFEVAGSGSQIVITGFDPGPTASDLTASVNLGQTIDLTAAILAKVKPGLAGDTETLTAFGPTSMGGLVALTNGDLTYGAQSNAALAHIPANGSVTDAFTYTVTDQLHSTATGTVSVTVSNPAVVIEGSLKGGGTIRGGSQTNIINAHGSGNTIIESGGNDVVSAGTGSATVTTGSGDVVVNLNGKNNTVNGGNGNDTVNMLTSGNSDVRLGTGTDSIVETVGSKGGNTFILTGSNASLTLYGANDVAFIDGGTDTIADHTKGLEVKIGKEGGVIDLSGFAADLTTGFIDLVGGVGGFKTAKAAVAALQSDGNGGTLLSLGASGQIDFVGVPVGALKVANFHIG
jgi:hypothetical protein